MKTKEMRIGKPIEIYVTREDYRFRMVTKVEEVAYDRVFVTLIVGRSKVFQFLDTDQIEFIYKDGERLYQWKNVKGLMDKLEGENVHCLVTTGDGQIYNRRNAYRVFLGEEIPLFIVKKDHPELLDDEVALLNEENKPYFVRNAKGLLKDFSETGAAVYSNEKLELQDFVRFQFRTEFGLIECTCEVIRIQSEKKGVYGTLYGLAFIQSSRNVTKYIFAQQRKNIKRERAKEL